MEIIFIETPDFTQKFDKSAKTEEMIGLQKDLLKDPTKGNLVKGTGGARKIRMKAKGKGKSSGARIIYYYIDLRGEIWFLDFYLKSDKEDLTEREKKRIYRFIKEKIHGQQY